MDLVLNNDHMMFRASEDLRGVDIFGEEQQHHDEGEGDQDDCHNVVGDLQNNDDGDHDNDDDDSYDDGDNVARDGCHHQSRRKLPVCHWRNCQSFWGTKMMHLVN